MPAKKRLNKKLFDSIPLKPETYENLSNLSQLKELQERQRRLNAVYNELLNCVQHNEYLQERLDEIAEEKRNLEEEIKTLKELMTKKS